MTEKEIGELYVRLAFQLWVLDWFALSETNHRHGFCHCNKREIL